MSIYILHKGNSPKPVVCAIQSLFEPSKAQITIIKMKCRKPEPPQNKTTYCFIFRYSVSRFAGNFQESVFLPVGHLGGGGNDQPAIRKSAPSVLKITPSERNSLAVKSRQVAHPGRVLE